MTKTIDDLKVPPHSIEAEQSVLGGLMLNNEAWDNIADVVNTEDFYRKDHRAIFRALKKLLANGESADAITVSEAIKSEGDLDEVGGLTYVATLAKDTPSVANIGSYARIVRERSVVRQLIGTGQEIANMGFESNGEDSRSLLNAAEEKIFAIAEQGEKTVQYQGIAPLIQKAVQHINEMSKLDSTITGQATGFTKLDEMTSGLQKGDLIIVAGRPSMGKTAFSMNIAENVATINKKPVLIYSMEMPAEQLALRLISSTGRVDQQSIRTGRVADEDWSRIMNAAMIFKESPLYIDDQGGLSPNELRARARRFVKEHGEIGLIIIDYLQLMQVNERAENRTTEVAEISRQLKNLAKELEVPVIVLSQLNRSLEQRPNKRPVMSDLRESGAIEQDADLILFIYRDEVYNTAPDNPEKGTAEIIIAKQRNGPIGTCKLTFIKNYTLFDNFSVEMDYPEAQPAMVN